MLARRAVHVAFVLVLTARSSAYAGLRDSLVGYWPFNGNAFDRSGQGRDLELVGQPTFAEGILGGSLSMRGDGEQYAIRDDSEGAFDFGGDDFTIQAWVFYNAELERREQTLVERWIGAGGPGWTLSTLLSAGDLHFNTSPPPNVSLVSPSGYLGALQWNHVVVRRTNAITDMFINNQMVGSSYDDLPLEPVSQHLIVGRRDFADERNFGLNGQLDELAIWRRGLSNDEVNSLYHGGVGSAVLPARQLTFDFNQGLQGFVAAGNWSASSQQLAVLSPLTEQYVDSPTFRFFDIATAAVEFSADAYRDPFASADFFGASLVSEDGSGEIEIWNWYQQSLPDRIRAPLQDTAIRKNAAYKLRFRYNDRDINFSLGPLSIDDVVISGASLLNSPQMPGDTNGDGYVDLNDLNNVRNSFGANGTGAFGDANGDEFVDLVDLNLVRNNFGAAFQVVPEPHSRTIMLLLSATCIAAVARSRHSYCSINK